MYMVGTIRVIRWDNYNKNKALNIFRDTLQLANINRYNFKYLYFIHGISINSYNLQSLDLILGNDILVKKKVQS